MGTVRDFSQDVEETTQVLREQQNSLTTLSPIISNPAKRMAENMFDNTVLLIAADPLTPVARRWRGQIAKRDFARRKGDSHRDRVT